MRIVLLFITLSLSGCYISIDKAVGTFDPTGFAQAITRSDSGESIVTDFKIYEEKKK